MQITIKSLINMLKEDFKDYNFEVTQIVDCVEGVTHQKILKNDVDTTLDICLSPFGFATATLSINKDVEISEEQLNDFDKNLNISGVITYEDKRLKLCWLDEHNEDMDEMKMFVVYVLKELQVL